MTKSDTKKSAMPTPVVEDPHPGSISDGTHPEAAEHRLPRADTHSGVGERISGTADKPALKGGQTDVNDEAPRHPNKGAYGS
ncbi:hypothetical protein [Shinella sp.]|uniref:hypothetical protein n=1 Tax=Shinella sp. TaxID=1870904 RepID=UPI0029B7A58C|nr:hypothetical protein [Shinella sp.]MDX3977011.1 hypothetical protein [Shinella sp.]